MNLKEIQSYTTIVVVLLSLTACSSSTSQIQNDDVVKKTGQTKSYDVDGVEVSDNSLFDDGYYEKGIKPKYTRNSTTEIVTDHITGLEWQDNYEVFSEGRSWINPKVSALCKGDYGYPSCPDEDCSPCYDTSGDTAITYCLELDLDGGGWRLPTVEELSYIVNKEETKPSINSTFKYIENSSYFTSSIIGGRFLPVTVDFHEGYSLKSFPKVYNFGAHIRCVRGDDNSSLLGSLSRNSQGIVTSNKTKLQWQDIYKSSELNTSNVNWEEAINYCETLDLNGTNWRLPNINELSTILNHKSELDTTFEIGYNAQYWSSTSYKGTTGGVLPGERQESNVLAWVLSTEANSYYVTSGEDKRRFNSVRCVR